MQRCPCCKARLRDSLICARCKADLSSLADSEQAAAEWLERALAAYLERDFEQSIHAVAISLQLKKTDLALSLRGFIAEQQSVLIVELLAEQRLLAAKKRLYEVRNLLPVSQQLQQLNAFSDCLLSQELTK
ncbi:MAG: hypothetical protein GQ582_04525 [Methyloprofundus sp.]|nr:hypothetical protein [Methyloprofundus sp.]